MHGSRIAQPGHGAGALAFGHKGLVFLLPHPDDLNISLRFDRQERSFITPKSDLCQGQILHPGSLLEARTPIAAGHLGRCRHEDRLLGRDRVSSA